MRLAPEVANRDCDHCQEFLYDEETGLVRRQKFGPVGDDGLKLPVLRRNAPLPCRTAAGCPKGTPERQLSLSEKNRRAYRHYQMCKATGTWPKDGMVRRNAGIIEAAISSAEITQTWLTKKHYERLEKILVESIKARVV